MAYHSSVEIDQLRRLSLNLEVETHIIIRRVRTAQDLSVAFEHNTMGQVRTTYRNMTQQCTVPRVVFPIVLRNNPISSAAFFPIRFSAIFVEAIDRVVRRADGKRSTVFIWTNAALKEFGQWGRSINLERETG